MNQLNRHLFCLLTELSSRKWLSERIGSFTKSKASRRLIRRFVKTYGIRVEEAEQPLDAYESLNAFFYR
ncbi:phosphatidylserine decarboxylase [Paenibacillus elgii]|uniref:phosphatidylserine decarboxylase n=1 Tax=Paenibacillus elgii TaxID=189691 RepID=UPI000248D336|nr:phosphatidylserine decarboxylase [Paenibacillus elgii]